MGLRLASGAVLLLLVLMAPTGGAWSVRDDDPLDESWFTGRLVWKQGAGAISWTGADTEDPGWQGVNPAPSSVPKPDEFLSDPLPQTLFLNVSRNLHLDLSFVSDARFTWCKGAGADAPIRVAIFSGSTLVAGSTSGGFLSEKPYENEPGYATCHYRLAPEARTLKAGSTLKVRVEYTQAGDAYKFRLAGDQGSVLRLSFFPAEDLFWREPDYFRENGSPAASPPSLLADILASLPVGLPLAALPLLARTRRARPSAVALMLALLLTAGCFGGTPKTAQGAQAAPPSGHASANIEDDRNLGFSEAGNGSILGVVHDDLQIPVASAHVALLGTAHATVSSSSGRFQFLNVGAGVYGLRVDKADYQSLEFETTVEPDRVTRVDVTLAPINASAVDARPHRHDYWQGEEALELFSGPVGRCGAGYQPTCTLPTGWTIPVKDDEADLVMPGTREVEVEVDWDPARVGYSRLVLLVRHNGDLWKGSINQSAFYPREPGAAVHMQTTWEMTDVGHQRFSTWSFALVGDPLAPATKDPLATTEVDAVHLTVRIHKGIVPLEPAHPDHWNGRNAINADTGKTRTMLPGRTTFTDNCLFWSQDDGGDGGAYYNGYPGPPIEWNYGSYGATFQLTGLVASGATQLVVEVRTQRAPRDAATGGYGLETWYKTGDTPAGQAFALPPYSFDRGTRAPNPIFQLAPAPTWSADGKVATWTLPLAPADADGVYNKRSSWQFVTMPDNLGAACNDAFYNVASAETGGGMLELKLNVTAKR